MKNIIRILTVVMLVCIFTFWGCEKEYLDVTNPNELTPDQFWKDTNDINKVIIAMYAGFQIPAWGEQWDFTEMYIGAHEARSDMIYWQTWQPQQGIAVFKATANQYMGRYLWKYHYQTIFTANQIIENVNLVKDLDPDKKAMYIAEAKFGRAHAYFNLLKDFGNIVLVTEPAQTPDDFYKSQVTKDEVWAQIESDFQDAKAHLPASWPEEWLGRATKGAATAYLGKAYLFQEKWAEAETEFKAVANMGYELISDYWSLFTGLNEFNKESVFEMNFSSDIEGGRCESTAHLDEWTGECWATDWGKQLFLSDTASDGSFTQRFYATALWDDPGCDVFYFNGMTYREYYTSQGVPDENRLFWKKYSVKRDNFKDRSTKDNNFYIIRYADVLLMLAEALNEQGKTTEAIPYVNLVRQRAGAIPIGSLDQAQLRDHIRHVERPLEFEGESTRYDDLVRWYGFGKEGGLKALLTAHDRYQVENFVDGVSELLPIPQPEINSNPNIEQNFGY